MRSHQSGPVEPETRRSIRSHLRQALRVPFYGIVARAAGSLGPEQAAIMLYHSVSDSPHPLSVRTREFERQIEYLGRHFEVVELSTLVARLTEEGGTGARPLAALTFDDGYKDNFEVVRPILMRVGMPATFYVTTGFVGGTCPPEWGSPPLPMMDWPDVMGLSKDGFEVASHTLTHPDLPALQEAALDRELRESRAELERRLGRPVASFAYPTGRYDGAVRRGVAAAGYTTAVTTCRRPASGQDDLLELPRIGIGRHVGFAHFQALISRAVAVPALMRL